MFYSVHNKKSYHLFCSLLFIRLNLPTRYSPKTWVNLSTPWNWYKNIWTPPPRENTESKHFEITWKYAMTIAVENIPTDWSYISSLLPSQGNAILRPRFGNGCQKPPGRGGWNPDQVPARQQPHIKRKRCGRILFAIFRPHEHFLLHIVGFEHLGSRFVFEHELGSFQSRETLES